MRAQPGHTSEISDLVDVEERETRKKSAVAKDAGVKGDGTLESHPNAWCLNAGSCMQKVTYRAQMLASGMMKVECACEVWNSVKREKTGDGCGRYGNHGRQRVVGDTNPVCIRARGRHGAALRCVMYLKESISSSPCIHQTYSFSPCTTNTYPPPNPQRVVHARTAPLQCAASRTRALKP
ncbi:hypothetical protein BDU57DRAFT_318346 [Ampelomyces quisqualis]|uniref:Uncharacterized protein n=1 Tax=Ampelomyces quisqualis TaxID=50730 RepID=A0A6A5QGP0_AMPQU|nr:hypothetical protein BDU57DRAFT_318346 [Ampelomyces quisqualis]